MREREREQIHSFQVPESSFVAQTSIYDSLPPVNREIIQKTNIRCIIILQKT